MFKGGGQNIFVEERNFASLCIDPFFQPGCNYANNPMVVTDAPIPASIDTKPTNATTHLEVQKLMFGNTENLLTIDTDTRAIDGQYFAFGYYDIIYAGSVKQLKQDKQKDL